MLGFDHKAKDKLVVFLTWARWIEIHFNHQPPEVSWMIVMGGDLSEGMQIQKLIAVSTHTP